MAWLFVKLIKKFHANDVFIPIVFLFFIIFSIQDVTAIHDLGPSCSTISPLICDTGEFLWSTESSDGHREELICSTTNPEECEIPYSINSNIQDIGLTTTEAETEIDNAVVEMNPISTNIGFIESAPTFFHDNSIRAGNLDPGTLGQFLSDRHCPFGFCDDHFTKFFITLNDDSNEIPWATEELCSGSSVIDFEPEKTLRHELFHALGFGHISSDTSSLLHTAYRCDPDGNTPTFHDIEEILEKYGGNWKITSDYIMNETVTGDTVMTIPNNVTIKSPNSLTINPNLTLDIDFLNNHIIVESGSKLIIKSGGKLS